MSNAKLEIEVRDQHGKLCALEDLPPATLKALDALLCQRLGVLPSGVCDILMGSVDDQDWGPPHRDDTKTEKKKKKKKTRFFLSA